jgi:ferredoxin
VGPNFIVIDPDECIDCALCEPECPVDAIHSEDDLSEDMKVFIEINARKSKEWPSITAHQDTLPDADDWKDVKGKLQYLEE